jgi:hypothetical protein
LCAIGLVDSFLPFFYFLVTPIAFVCRLFVASALRTSPPYLSARDPVRNDMDAIRDGIVRASRKYFGGSAVTGNRNKCSVLKTDRCQGQNMARTEVPLKSASDELYARFRAQALPRIQAYREAGWHSKKDDVAYGNACRLERRPGVGERIEFLSHQAEELIASTRLLWTVS